MAQAVVRAGPRTRFARANLDVDQANVFSHCSPSWFRLAVDVGSCCLHGHGHELCSSSIVLCSEGSRAGRALRSSYSECHTRRRVGMPPYQ